VRFYPAAAIARQVNIFLPGHFTRSELAQLKGVEPEQVDEDEIDAVVVTGPEIDHFTEADWARVLSKDDIVFARTTPQQKLTIVEHLQAMGHVVAATGDGVNGHTHMHHNAVARVKWVDETRS